MSDRDIGWQEGYEAGMAHAQELYGQALERERKVWYEKGYGDGYLDNGRVAREPRPEAMFDAAVWEMEEQQR
jgi:hypothetical protein